ncbi:hypothetical protein, partial [Alteromonas australica]
MRTQLPFMVMANINHISNQNGCINTLTQHTSGLPYLQKTTCGTTNVVYNAYSWDANGNLTACSGPFR